MYRLLLTLAILLTALTGCTPAQDNAPPSGTADSVILTSTTVLADITRNITGDRLTVESLLPTGADPHSYQPTPQDVARIENSPLIILNGAEYEHFLEPLLENASAEKMIIEAGAGVTVREDAGGEHGVDPHMWLDPNNIMIYVENIREALTHYDPDGAAEYQANATAYLTQLRELDVWITEQVSQIPAERKLLITNHEALGYFAERYGFTIAGSVVESFSSDASPSAQQMAELIEVIRAQNAPAIFLDAGDNPALAEQIASETGVRVVTNLHLESLTDGAPAVTYLEMMRHNVNQIVAALR